MTNARPSHAGASGSDGGDARPPATAPTPAAPSAPNWEGDGTSAKTFATTANGAATPRRAEQPGGDDEVDATDWRAATNAAVPPAPPGLSLRLRRGRPRRAGFLIESLNDDGYLDEPLEDRSPRGLAGATLEEPTRTDAGSSASLVALRLLQTWSRPASARAIWPSA